MKTGLDTELLQMIAINIKYLIVEHRCRTDFLLYVQVVIGDYGNFVKVLLGVMTVMELNFVFKLETTAPRFGERLTFHGILMVTQEPLFVTNRNQFKGFP